MSGFTDIHSHFIYGIDDGARDRETMEAMLDAAWNDGIRKLIATPHTAPGVRPFDVQSFRLHYAEAVNYCRESGYDMELLAGAENLWTPALPGYAQTHGLITLCGTRYLLVEFVPDAGPAEIRGAADFLSGRGYIPVLAHVERYENLPYREAARLSKEYEMFFQMNCGTVLHEKGFAAKRNAHKLLKSGLIACLACDAHDCHGRHFNMSRAYKRLGEEYGREFADRLCRA